MQAPPHPTTSGTELTASHGQRHKTSEVTNPQPSTDIEDLNHGVPKITPLRVPHDVPSTVSVMVLEMDGVTPFSP